MTRILPASGLIRVLELAEFLETDIKSVIEHLIKDGVPILKITSHKKSWLVKLEDLK
jgi:hypothetical protein